METLEEVKKAYSALRANWFKLPANPTPKDLRRYEAQKKRNREIKRKLYALDPEVRRKAMEYAAKWIREHNEYHKALCRKAVKTWQKRNRERYNTLMRFRYWIGVAQKKGDKPWEYLLRKDLTAYKAERRENRRKQ